MSDSGADTVTVVSASIAVTKTLTSADPTSNGSTVSFDIVVTNDGSEDLENLQVTDNLDTAFGAGTYSSVSVSSGDFSVNGGYDGSTDTDLLDGTDTLAAGASGTITLSLQIDSTTDGLKNNTAAGDADGVVSGSNVSDSGADTVTVVSAAEADLSLTKIVNDSSPDLGDTVTFTLMISNSGPNTATNIVVEDVIPAGLTYVPGSITGGDSNDDTDLPVLTWDINSMTSGASAFLTFQTTVDIVGTSTNVAEVIAVDQTDPDSAPDNNDGFPYEDDEDDASVTVATIVDPALTKTGDPAAASVGDTVVFTITVENEGNTDALDVEVIDTLPVFLDVIDVTVVPAPAAPPVIVGNTITIDFGTVTTTDFYTITVTTEVNALGAPPGGTNTVGLTTSSLDEDLTNNDDDFFLAIGDGGLPETGFAPGVVTLLPAQPENARYTDLFSLGLEIPKLDVDIPIVGVPKIESGWDVTWLWDDAGYLEGTAFPTWEGNTAITGHVTLPSGLPGPFAGLGTLGWGDEIVINFFGMRYEYSVREVRWVEPDDMSSLGHEELDWVTLITCSGFNEQTGAYNWRTIVRAVLIKVEPQR